MSHRAYRVSRRCLNPEDAGEGLIGGAAAAARARAYGIVADEDHSPQTRDEVFTRGPSRTAERDDERAGRTHP